MVTPVYSKVSWLIRDNHLEIPGVFLSCSRIYTTKEKDMQCEALTPVCSNQRVQLLGSVYMCCNKLTATYVYRGKWKPFQIANLIYADRKSVV